MQETKKKHFLPGALALAISLGVTAGLLGTLLRLQPASAGGQAGAKLSLLEALDGEVSASAADALAALAPEKETEKRVYQLRDEELVAPVPKAECYGDLSTQGELEELLAAAGDLLAGEKLYFSLENPLRPGAGVRYYRDETILAITWKEVHGKSVYTCSEVKIAHPSQFRRFLAGGAYGSGKQYTATEMAASVNAVVASDGDFYGYRPNGTNIYNGRVYRVDKTNLHTCMIDEKGDLRFAYGHAFENEEEAQAYVDENGIRFGLCFGPVLVEDGQLREVGAYAMGEVRENYARAGLCQLGPCHYLLCTANYERDYYLTPTLAQFSQVLWETGCTQAYALDGGQSATLVMDGQLINAVSYGDERKLSDIIYFATALP